ncbi:MAG: CHAT domain-containing protein, partial [Waterburya sp.]
MDDALERGKYREQFSLRRKDAVRIDDLQSSLQKEAGRIVHFCGHGMGSQGLVLDTSSGQHQLLDTQAIADLFRLFANQIECVVLNACYSRVQAVEISKHINYVIGTKQEIRDDAAIAFSKGFYEALGNGETIERAYEFGCNRIQLDIYGSSQGDRKLVPVYSTAENQYIELHQHQVIELLIKESPNTIIEASSSPTDRQQIWQRPLMPRSPYKGLKRFNAKDKDLFFGRERLINQLIQGVNQSNLVLVLGASGSGKSSVVRAGVIPQLESLAETPSYCCLFTPNRDPFVSFHRSLLNPEADIFTESEVEFVLQGNSNTFSKTAELFRSKQPQSQCLIFIDQFEELFTLCPNLETRRNLIQGIVDFAQDTNNSVKLILAMRSDFLEEFGAYPQFARIAEKNIKVVADMQAEELRQAIEQPAANHGIVFESGLVNEIIRDVQGQAGSLPLLQYTLDLLWQNDDLSDRTLNISTYRQLGGVSGALQKHVNEIYQGLPPKQQLATKQILLRLVDVVAIEQSEVLRTAVSKRAYKSEFTETQAETVKLLVNQSLLVSDDLQQEGQSTVEIAHEALLSSWAELKEWIRDARNTIALNNRLAEDATRWQELKNQNSPRALDELWSGSKLEKAIELRKDGTFEVVLGGLGELADEFIDASIDWRDKEQQEKVRLQRRAIKFLTGGLALAVVAAVGAFWQRGIALKQSKMAFVRQLAATSEFIREQKANLHETSVLLALESYKRSDDIHKPNRPSSEANSALYNGLDLLPNHLRAAISHQDAVRDIQFSGDSQYLATASQDGTAKLVEIATGQETVISHQDEVWEIQFSGDSQYLATASWDGTAKLVEIATGQETV